MARGTTRRSPCSRPPQSRQYRTCSGLPRPQRAQFTSPGERGQAIESTPHLPHRVTSKGHPRTATARRPPPGAVPPSTPCRPQSRCRRPSARRATAPPSHPRRSTAPFHRAVPPRRSSRRLMAAVRRWRSVAGPTSGVTGEGTARRPARRPHQRGRGSRSSTPSSMEMRWASPKPARASARSWPALSVHWRRSNGR